MMRRLCVALLGSAAAMGAGSAQAANLLTNGSFESRIVTASDKCEAGPFNWCVRSFASTPGWTQFGDGVDLIHNNYSQGDPDGPFGVLVDASDGVNFLDMNQAGVLGGIFEVVSAEVGATYTLSVDITAWARNSVPGSVGYQLYNPLDNAILASGSFAEAVDNHTWDTLTLSAQATSNQIGVRIQGLSARQAGMGVDNVILTGGGGAVPEPATWGLMILGFGAAGAMARRRRVAAA